MDISKYFGNYRAKVLNNKDTEMYGRVLLWIPDIMPDIIPSDEPDPIEIENDESGVASVFTQVGLWAYPANNPIGGRSGIENEDQWGQGSCYIPKIGAYVWVFFEGGNINRPWYFGSLELETSKVLPENQAGGEYQHKWTLFKSSQGRCIIISDDCDERIEITGKKRLLTKSADAPEGDIASVYQIDGNQTTILLEETEDNEKLLIRTYKGDYINIDITQQELHCQFKNNIYFKTESDFYIDALNIHFNASDSLYMTASTSAYISSTKPLFITSLDTVNIYSGTNLLLYGVENTSVVSDGNLFLTGTSSIHQSTAINLIGGKVNIGKILPRRISGSPGMTAGQAATANIPNPAGYRATDSMCSSYIPPSTVPILGNPSITGDIIDPTNPFVLPITPPTPPDILSVNSLISSNMTPDDLFSRDE